MAIIEDVLPTVKVIDHIQVAKTKLAYLDTTDIKQDLVPIMASLDQLYDLLPEGKAKEHTKQAKEALIKEKKKGSVKAKQEMEAVEESLDFSEVDLSVSRVSHWIEAAKECLDKGETKQAGDVLIAAVDGVMFVDFDVVDPASVAAREIWLATQDWAAKNPKATMTRLEKAKTALQEVVNSGNMSQQDQAKHLIGMIDAIDVTKGGDQTGKALQDLWQGARKLDTNQPILKKN